MIVKLSSAAGCEEVIARFRAEICERLQMSKTGTAGAALPYSSYLFVYRQPGGPPVGMTEFFFYDQAFARYEDSVYGRAADLGAIAPMSRMAHLRSVCIDAAHRRTRVFLVLLAATIRTADAMGAHFMTGGTGLHNEDILALHRNADMRVLGRYEVEGRTHQLALLPLAALAQRVRGLRMPREVFDPDPQVLERLRALGRAAPHAAQGGRPCWT